MSNSKNINIQDLQNGYENEQEFYDKFRERLADVQQFPGEYTFKFIVPSKNELLEPFKTIFGQDAKYAIKESTKGTYSSVTIVKQVKDAAAVVYYYKSASSIEKIMML